MTKVTLDILIRTREEMQKRLKPSRYEHTLGVAYTASCLGMKYGVDPLLCELCGLLHDCAKNIPDPELQAKCEEAGIELTEGEKTSPQLWHAAFGAYLVKEEFGFTDPDMIHSVRYHTTGRPGMSMLEKIIYIADFIEPLRDKASCLNKARELAFLDIDKCMDLILSETVKYLEGCNVSIEKNTLLAYKYYHH